MSLSFDRLETAARFRDIMRRQQEKTISVTVPGPRVGRVFSVDFPRLKAMVWFPGDDFPIEVNLFPSSMPGDWQDRYELTGEETSTVGKGSLVVVELLNGSLYLSHVLSGGQLAFDSRILGMSMVTQLPQSGDGGGPQLAGESFEMYANAEVFGNLSDGDAVMFGPFSSEGESIYLGLTEMTIQLGDSAAVKHYRFLLNAKEMSKFSGSNDPLTFSWFRILPEREIVRQSSTLCDFDLEVCLKLNSVLGPAAVQYNETGGWEVMFRLVKRGTWGNVAAKVTVRTTAFSRTRGSNTQIFGNETLIGPLNYQGCIGFEASHAGIRQRTSDNPHDNFRRTVTNGFGNTVSTPVYYRPSGSVNTIGWSHNAGDESAFSVTDPDATITMSSTNKLWWAKAPQMEAGGYVPNQDILIQVSAGQISTGAAVYAGIHTKYSTDTSWGIRFRMEFGLTGSLVPRIERNNAGTPTTLASGSALTYAADQYFWVRASMSDMKYQMKVWEVGDDEPTDWNVSTVDNVVIGGLDFVLSGFRVTGNTNTNAIVRFRDLTSRGINPISTSDITDKRWHPGSWPSSPMLLSKRLADTWTHEGNFTWSGADLGWTGEIVLGSVGRNRNGLITGWAYITQPLANQTISIMPNGTLATVTSTGVPLSLGQSLWCAIPPGYPDFDLNEFLFIVDSTFVRDYELPEWAILIAARPRVHGRFRLGNGSMFPHYGQVVCELRATSVQSIANASVVSYNWQTEDLDLLNAHSTSVNTNRFTPTIPGKYSPRGGVSFSSNATGYRAASIAKNGTAQNGTEARVAAVNGASTTMVVRSIALPCDGVSDYLDIEVQQNSGAALNTNATGSQSGALQWEYVGPP